MIGQVFHVSPGGEVTTPSYPETLHVIRLDRTVDKAGTELPPAFIEVGDWTYPLVRGKSPIMKSSYGETITPWKLCDNPKHQEATCFLIWRRATLPGEPWVFSYRSQSLMWTGKGTIW